MSEQSRDAMFREQLGAWWAEEFPSEVMPTEALTRLSERLATCSMFNMFNQDESATRLLLDTELARLMYRESPLYHALVSLVRRCEHDGMDPWPWLRDALVSLAQNELARTTEAVERAKRELTPMILLPVPRHDPR